LSLKLFQSLGTVLGFANDEASVTGLPNGSLDYHAHRLAVVN
jgi:hypothetical protein